MRLALSLFTSLPILGGMLFCVLVEQRLLADGVVNSCTQAELESALGSGGTVTFACDGTITLSNTITISQDTLLDGSGHTVTISGNNAVRIFTVDPCVKLALVNLTIADGFQASTNSSCGGGIFNNGGIFSATNCTFVSNQVGHASVNVPSFGGALCNSNGTATVVQCRFFDNLALGGDGQGTNDVGKNGNGGALDNGCGTLVVIASLFVGNKAQGGVGRSRSGPGWRTSGIGGGALGGAIFNGDVLLMTNSTLVTNSARSGIGVDFLDAFGWGDPARGGAIYNDGGIATLVHATIAGNTAVGYISHFSSPPGQGGGLFGGDNGTLRLVNSIVANSALGGNCYGSIVDGGHNISSDSSCPFSATGSLTNTDPMLGPLGYYGGHTQVLPLREGSPAIDAADQLSCPESDQRGFPRPVGCGCDIGSFEGDIINFPSLSAAFRPTTIMTGSVAVLAFTLRNPNREALSNVSFTNALAAPLRIAASAGVMNSCGSGIVQAAPGSSLVSVTGINLDGYQTCTVAVNLTSHSRVVVTNVIGPPSALETGPGPQGASAVLTAITPCDLVYPGTNYAVQPKRCGQWLRGSGGGMNNLAEMTIEMWAQWTGIQARPHGAYAQKPGTIFDRKQYDAGAQAIIALHDVDPTRAKVTWSPYDGNTALIGTTTVGDGVWHHIAVTFRSGDHRLYIDGVLEGASGAAGTLLDYGNLDLGYLDGATAFCALDEVRIWKVIRTAEQIRQYMNYVVDASDPALAAYWRMDSFPTGGSVPDLTGHGYFLQLDYGASFPSCVSWWIVSTAPVGRGMLLSSQFTGGKLQVILTGAAAQTYVLQSSTDLLHWSNVATNNPASDCVLIYEDPMPVNASQRFFRGVSP